MFVNAQGLLERMEEEVSDFFESAEDPNESIYESCLPSGFQRMLLQATSQYLNLVCKSKFHVNEKKRNDIKT